MNSTEQKIKPHVCMCGPCSTGFDLECRFERSKEIFKADVQDVLDGEHKLVAELRKQNAALLEAAKYFRSLVDADLLDSLTRNGNPYNEAIAQASGDVIAHTHPSGEVKS